MTSDRMTSLSLSGLTLDDEMEEEQAPRAWTTQDMADGLLPVSISSLMLRRPTLDDTDDMTVWFSNAAVSRFCTFDAFQSRDDVANYIRDIVMPHPWFRAISLHGRAIGAVSVARYWGNDVCRGEIGYVLALQYWGKGIGTEAVKLAVASVFQDQAGLERLEALVEVDNIRSQRVLEKAGFTREGVLRKYRRLKGDTRDMVMFSFISTDPLCQ